MNVANRENIAGVLHLCGVIGDREMDYQLENLGPDGFQEVCQALLSKEFPRTQCFPIGQADGGRDAISRLRWVKAAGPFMVFQVKFVRDPSAIRDPHKWLVNIIKEELPKISALIPRGAHEYYVLTNVRGTARANAGSIDTVQSVLDESLPVPGQCWWRDDLNRRLDNAFDIKWAHPGILTGPDILRHVIEMGLTENAERRTSAVRAFIRDQYEREKQVRFKQVELQNTLFDLFVDVPITMPGTTSRRQTHFDTRQHTYMLLRHHLRQMLQESESQDEDIGAATLLLHPQSSVITPKIVMEGAPGQGKSTVTQYVCQIHRSRILGETTKTANIPRWHQDQPVRLPLKVDLRDFSAWVTGKDPFAPTDPGKRQKGFHKSLESFLAAQITFHSGGTAFSVADLHAVAKLSSILLVLDALDEVADISVRREVVDEVVKGVHRLTEIAASLQVVVTSRPTAFADSPGFPDDEYLYFELGSISPALVGEYAAKWMRAKHVDTKEAVEIRRILAEKLDLPHLRELARNPMQLAILLSLIHTRGASLPDKRTALYDSYVDLFFDREAEKSALVREHRDLLIDMHRYVAWVLHSQAEMGNNTGSVTTERLHKLIRDYLHREQHDTAIAERLFAGVVERVVLLVSRVEGTFEFEVQPLREYFAARYLYDTAPYSPAGSEKPGTLPDRFSAIARNSYWLNVTRFFAGCFSKGQLPSLLEGLEELSQADDFKYTGIAQELGSVLLGDWVFAQSPRCMRKVAELMCNPTTFKQLLYKGHGRPNPLVLPTNCGNDRLIQHSLSLLERFPSSDYADALIAVLTANWDPAVLERHWIEKTRGSSGETRTKWLDYGVGLNCLSKQTPSLVKELLSDTPLNKTRIDALLRSNQSAYITETEQVLESTLSAILDRTVTRRYTAETYTICELLIETLDAQIYAYASRDKGQAPLSHFMRHYSAPYGHTVLAIEKMTPLPEYASAHRALEVVKIAAKQCSRSGLEWATTLRPWNAIVERARALFGERWAFYHMATIGAGIESTTEKCEGSNDLLDASVPLCPRARFARLRTRNVSWWADQLNKPETLEQRMFVSLVCLAWAGIDVLVRHLDQIGEMVDNLEPEAWRRLSDSLRRTGTSIQNRRGREGIGFETTNLPTHLSARTSVLLSSCKRITSVSFW
jgi:hypothetical protein